MSCVKFNIAFMTERFFRPLLISINNQCKFEKFAFPISSIDIANFFLLIEESDIIKTRKRSQNAKTRKTQTFDVFTYRKPSVGRYF